MRAYRNIERLRHIRYLSQLAYPPRPKYVRHQVLREPVHQYRHEVKPRVQPLPHAYRHANRIPHLPQRLHAVRLHRLLKPPDIVRLKPPSHLNRRRNVKVPMAVNQYLNVSPHRLPYRRDQLHAVIRPRRRNRPPHIPPMMPPHLSRKRIQFQRSIALSHQRPRVFRRRLRLPRPHMRIKRHLIPNRPPHQPKHRQPQRLPLNIPQRNIHPAQHSGHKPAIPAPARKAPEKLMPNPVNIRRILPHQTLPEILPYPRIPQKPQHIPHNHAAAPARTRRLPHAAHPLIRVYPQKHKTPPLRLRLRHPHLQIRYLHYPPRLSLGFAPAFGSQIGLLGLRLFGLPRSLAAIISGAPPIAGDAPKCDNIMRRHFGYGRDRRDIGQRTRQAAAD